MLRRLVILSFLPIMLLGQFFSYLPFEYQSEDTVSSRVVLLSNDTLYFSFIRFDDEYVYGHDIAEQVDHILDWDEVLVIEFNLDISLGDFSTPIVAKDLLVTNNGERIACAVLEISSLKATFVRSNSRRKEQLDVRKVDNLALFNNTRPNPYATPPPALAEQLGG